MLEPGGERLREPAPADLPDVRVFAEFAGTTPYEQLYQNAGGQAAQRDSFTRTVMRHGYIEINEDGTVLLTPRGREESRRMMQGKGW